MAMLAVLSAAQLVTGRPVGAVATFFQHEVRSAQVYSGKGGGSLLKRVQGTFFSTDVFAMFLLYVVLWLVAVTRTVKSRFVMLTLLGSGVLIAVTFSRGVWLATLLTVPLDHDRVHPAPAARAVATDHVRRSRSSSPSRSHSSSRRARSSPACRHRRFRRSAQTRDTATQVAICLPSIGPWFGVGYGAMAPRQNHIADCNPNGNDIRAHNIYVQDWAEQGIFTLLAYLAVGFTMLWEALRRRRVDDPGNRAMRTAVAFSILAWLMFMGVYATANDFNVMPIWILLGGYSLTLLDTSRKIVEPLGGLGAARRRAAARRRELAPV